MAGSLVSGVLAAALALGACGIPRDPESTLERVSGGVMRVGIAPKEPWTSPVAGGSPTGVEVTVLEDFAHALDARIEWITGTEAELFAALEVRELDVAIGGFDSENAWSAKVTFTHPYLTTPAVIGVPEDQPIPNDVDGLEVSVERGSHLAGLVEKTDARPVEVDDLAASTGAAAVDNWLLDDLGLKDTGIRLDETDHVMAVPHGENAWLVRLERFLLARESAIEDLLAEEGSL
jgi:polar amino acid transport system substrate-binding protein